MQFKKTYTAEEVDEVIRWFEDHMDSLPETVQLDVATRITDFPRTVRLYFDIARLHHDNPTYAGQVLHLFRMREAVEAQ